jgi:HEAT repeat protein
MAINSQAGMSRRLIALLKIQPSEMILVVLVTGLMFLTTAGAAIGSPGVEALFFSRVGVQFLPHMYIALGVLIALTSLSLTVILSRVDHERLYVILPLAMATLLVGTRVLVTMDLTWFYALLWLGMNVSWTLLNLFIWGVAGMVCDTRQAKRLFPLFSAGSILGLTAGGLVTKPLVEWLGTVNLLLVWAATLVGAFFLCQAIVRTQEPVAPSAHQNGRSIFGSVKQGYEFARSSNLMRWMAMAAVLFALLYYSVVFPFAKAVAAEIPQEDGITAFLGVFQGVATGTAFLVSLLLANRLYARFGFLTTILVYPVLYFLGFSILTIQAGFTALVVFRFSQLLWSEGVSEGANQAMYNLVPPERREQTRTFVRGVMNPLGVSLVGGILLASERILPAAAIYLIGLTAGALTVYLVWQARGAYGSALVEALRAGRPHLFYNEDAPSHSFQLDAAALDTVLQGISSQEAAVRRVSAEILGHLAVPEAVDTMVSALDDPDPTVRAALLRSLAKADASHALLEVVLALDDPSPEVRAQAIQTLDTLVPYSRALSRYLEPKLGDVDPSVRIKASVCLLKAGSHPQAESVLKGLATEGDLPVRVEALKAFAEWGSQSAYEVAAKSLNDPHPVIRRQAASILARIDADQCVFPLVATLGDEDSSVRQAAASALGGIGEPALQPVTAALHNPDQEAGALLALRYLPIQPVKDRLMAYAQDRVEKALYYHSLWRGSLNQENSQDRSRLVSESLHHTALRNGTNALKATALLGNRQGVTMAIEQLDSRNPEQRANALETLDSLGDREIVTPLIGLWEEQEDLDPPPEDWLAKMLRDRDPWLRACAVLVAMESGDPDIKETLTSLKQNDPNPLVRDTAHKVLSGESDMQTLTTLSLMEKILFLKRVPLFIELVPDDLKSIAAITGEQVFSDGEVISEQGEMGDEMFIIVSGEVRVLVDSEGHSQQEIVRREPGEIVGEMSILDQSPRMASLVAAGEVRVLCIAQPDFEEILRLRPETSLAVMRVLCDRLRERERQG